MGSFSCLLNEADEFKEIQDGRSEMADSRWRDAKMTILSLIWSKSAKFHVFQKYTFRKYIIDALYTKKSIFTPSGTVFSKFIALELLSETLRNKWCHNDVTARHSDITVSVVVRISAYTILCKLGGHSVGGFKVT